MPLNIVHHGRYDAEFPVRHRFPMGKYRRLMEILHEEDLAAPGAVHVAAPAPASWLKLVHDGAYVDRVIAAAVPAEIEKEIGFPVSERVSLRARLASAGTVLAARLALEFGVACNTAGGSHHAKRLHGAGFCTFNDVAVAASVLLAEGTVGRALVVDLDVHQGDGTAEIFTGDDRVFTFSMHGERNYPTRKIPSDLDIELADGTGDDAYLETLEHTLPRLLARTRPDIVFYNAGVDPHAEDRLGRLKLSNDGLRRRDAAVMRFFRERGIPVCGVLGGGYSHDIDALARRHAILFRTAAGFAG
jgi:acetoin utilization deacetylase AcuC-like enzyme